MPAFNAERWPAERSTVNAEWQKSKKITNEVVGYYTSLKLLSVLNYIFFKI